MTSDPRLDPATTGISFVDILFALVVGKILDPVAEWIKNPGGNPIEAATFVHLAAALVLVVTSWVGYHNSANRARFKLRFVNVELVKFTLDILMVILYFVVAAYALRVPLTSRPETLLVLGAFVLYLLWDFAGAWQKRQGSGYKTAWDAAHLDSGRPDVVEPWTPTDWRRVRVTAGGVLVSAVIAGVVWAAVDEPTAPRTSIVIDGVLLALLVGYRILKDQLRTTTTTTGAAP